MWITRKRLKDQSKQWFIPAVKNWFRFLVINIWNKLDKSFVIGHKLLVYADQVQSRLTNVLNDPKSKSKCIFFFCSLFISEFTWQTKMIMKLVMHWGVPVLFLSHWEHYVWTFYGVRHVCQVQENLRHSQKSDLVIQRLNSCVYVPTLIFFLKDSFIAAYRQNQNENLYSVLLGFFSEENAILLQGVTFYRTFVSCTVLKRFSWVFFKDLGQKTGCSKLNTAFQEFLGKFEEMNKNLVRQLDTHLNMWQKETYWKCN